MGGAPQMWPPDLITTGETFDLFVVDSDNSEKHYDISLIQPDKCLEQLLFNNRQDASVAFRRARCIYKFSLAALRRFLYRSGFSVGITDCEFLDSMFGLSGSIAGLRCRFGGRFPGSAGPSAGPEYRWTYSWTRVSVLGSAEDRGLFLE